MEFLLMMIASLDLLDNGNCDSWEPPVASLPDTTPPTTASVHVLLKQALHADDRALLLDCLYNRDEKACKFSSTNNSVKGSSFGLCNSMDKESVKHTGGIMSQESSLVALISMYQLIESRISTVQTVEEVSSSLDFLCMGIVDDLDEGDDAGQVIYEFKDTVTQMMKLTAKAETLMGE